MYEQHYLSNSVLEIIREIIEAQYNTSNIARFNDNFSYADVMLVLHKAKELAIAQEQAQCETQKHTTA